MVILLDGSFLAKLPVEKVMPARATYLDFTHPKSDN
jgi:hypothetical protein